MAKISDVIEGQTFPRAENVGCYICQSTSPPRTIRVRFGQIASVAECTNCRLAYQTPQPSPEASLAYMNWRWNSTSKYVANSADQKKRADKQLALVHQQRAAPGKLLDFGAGCGAFLQAARNAGWDADGVESSKSARDRGKSQWGVELLQELPDDSYDIITLWDVIEHLRDPAGLLAVLGARLNPGGVLFIETGNHENWQRIAQRDKWGLYLFDHQFYFTPHSLRLVTERAGLRSFSLLDCNHVTPTVNPVKCMFRPINVLRSWWQWRQAKSRWPEHGDINVMLAIVRGQ